MRGSMNDLPGPVEIPEGVFWQVEWGDNAVEFGRFKDTFDLTPYFAGLPDDRCQCPHWGYVIKGTLHYRFDDHEETYTAGDAYYAPPGHVPLMEPGLEYVEISPAAELAKTMAVVEQNFG